MNLQILKKSKIPPAVGDIFALQLAQIPGNFYFGRVVKTDAKVGGFNNTILVYIYRSSSPSKTSIPPLAPHNLLVPPMATNALPWCKGYFETIENRSIAKSDLLSRHVFRDAFRKKLFDDHGRETTATPEPIGIFGLHSYQTIDDEISRALGVPLSSL